MSELERVIYFLVTGGSLTALEARSVLLDYAEHPTYFGCQCSY